MSEGWTFFDYVRIKGALGYLKGVAKNDTVTNFHIALDKKLSEIRTIANRNKEYFENEGSQVISLLEDINSLEFNKGSRQKVVDKINLALAKHEKGQKYYKGG